MTKRMLTKYIVESSLINNKKVNNNYVDSVFITNAIMCGRQGANYRDSINFKVKECTLNCIRFLKTQINIVQPKVILTLGYYPLLSLSKVYNFEIEKTLVETISKSPIIELEQIIIIPLYHPAAQISYNKQIEQYNKIWKYV